MKNSLLGAAFIRSESLIGESGIFSIAFFLRSFGAPIVSAEPLSLNSWAVFQAQVAFDGRPAGDEHKAKVVRPVVHTWRPGRSTILSKVAYRVFSEVVSPLIGCGYYGVLV